MQLPIARDHEHGRGCPEGSSSLPLTIGQFDSVNGTNRRLPLERDVMAVAVTAPSLVDDDAARAACRATAQAHAALRAHLMADPGAGGRQIVKDDASRPRLPMTPPLTCWFAAVSVEEADLQIAMNRHIDDFVSRADVRGGKTWSVCLLKTRSRRHILFAFTHFTADYFSLSQYVRTYIRLLQDPEDAIRSRRCRYAEYARGLHAHHASAAEVERYLDLIHTAEPLPDTGFDAPLTSVRSHRRRGSPGSGLDEFTIMRALHTGLRELTDLPAFRIDATRLGRSTSAARSAGGWLAHAVPQFFMRERCTREDLGRHDARFPKLFYPVRERLGAGNPRNYCSHVLLNYFGKHDPRAWSFRGFRMSAIQPQGVPRARRSDTPIHLKVRLIEDDWHLIWKGSRQATESGTFDALVGDVSRRLGARPQDVDLR